MYPTFGVCFKGKLVGKYTIHGLFGLGSRNNWPYSVKFVEQHGNPVTWEHLDFWRSLDWSHSKRFRHLWGLTLHPIIMEVENGCM